MHARQVIGKSYWKEVRKKARCSDQKSAAIAFVTQDLIGLSNGDTLVVNASLTAIRGGETDAKLLLRLHKEGVDVFNCSNLHAKVLLLGDTAIIGSGNMSRMSSSPAGGWQEAGYDSVIVAGVESFIEQLISVKDALLDGKHSARAPQEKVETARVLFLLRS